VAAFVRGHSWSIHFIAGHFLDDCDGKELLTAKRAKVAKNFSDSQFRDRIHPLPLCPSAKNAAIAPPSSINAPIADDRQAFFR
jgi:hypothetical protein